MTQKLTDCFATTARNCKHSKGFGVVDFLNKLRFHVASSFLLWQSGPIVARTMIRPVASCCKAEAFLRISGYKPEISVANQEGGSRMIGISHLLNGRLDRITL